MPNATILNSQRRQKDAGESVQYQETFIGNAIALHTFSIIVTTAHPFQALAVYVTEDENTSPKHTIIASVNERTGVVDIWREGFL